MDLEEESDVSTFFFEKDPSGFSVENGLEGPKLEAGRLVSRVRNRMAWSRIIAVNISRNEQVLDIIGGELVGLCD